MYVNQIQDEDSYVQLICEDHSLSSGVTDVGALCQVLNVTVATWFSIPISELQAKTRRRAKVAFARQVAMYMTHVLFELSLTDVGFRFNRDRTTAAHACRVVEDCRDDPRVDEMLDHIEAVISNWRNGIETWRICG